MNKETLMTPEQRWQLVLAMQRMEAERFRSRQDMASLGDTLAVVGAVAMISALGAAVMLAASIWAA